MIISRRQIIVFPISRFEIFSKKLPEGDSSVFQKTRSSHKVRFLGLGFVPNEPVQKLAQVRICTLLARY